MHLDDRYEYFTASWLIGWVVRDRITKTDVCYCDIETNAKIIKDALNTVSKLEKQL